VLPLFDPTVIGLVLYHFFQWTLGLIVQWTECSNKTRMLNIIHRILRHNTLIEDEYAETAAQGSSTR
jgi:hypothetical protein